MSTIFKKKVLTTFLSLIIILLLIIVVVLCFQVTTLSKTQKEEIVKLTSEVNMYLQEKGYSSKDIKNIDVDYHYHPEFEMPMAFVEFSDEVGVFYIYFKYNGVLRQQPMIETTEEFRRSRKIKYTSEIDESTLKHYEYANKTELTN